MWGKLLAGAGILALAAFLVLRYGTAREEAGRLAERAARLKVDVAAERASADLRVAAEQRVTAATAAFAERTAALKPIVITSRERITEYAHTAAGAALCLGADRVSGLDQLDASLFPAAAGAASGGDGTLPADAGASPAER